MTSLGKHSLRGIAGKVALAELCPPSFGHRKLGLGESLGAGGHHAVDIAGVAEKVGRKTLVAKSRVEGILQHAEEVLSPGR